MTISTTTDPAFTGPAATDSCAAPGPRLIRVSVLAANQQVDVGLPCDISVSAVLADLVALINTPATGESPGHEIRRTWTLRRVGQAPLAPQLSLAENEVHEGDLLILQDDRIPERPPMFDDVVDAIAALNAERHAPWTTGSANQAGRVLGVVAAVVGAIALASSRHSSPALWPAALAIAAMIAFVAAAAVVARILDERATGTALSLSASAFAASSGILLVPGDFTAEHVLLAAAMTACATTLSYRITGTDPLAHVAVITAAALIGIASAISVLWQPDSSAPIGALLAACGLLTIASAPRFTMLLTRLPLPPVPNAGDALDPADIAPRPTIAGIGAVGTMALPAADVLADRVDLARRHLTGIIGGAVAGTAAGTIVVTTAATRWPAIIFVTVVATILVAQCRTYSDRTQAATVLIGGSMIGCALIFALMTQSVSWALAAAGAAATMSLLAFACGIWLPASQFSPVLRRAAEIGEYLLVGSVVPLLLWVMDVYRLVRDL